MMFCLYSSKMFEDVCVFLKFGRRPAVGLS